MQPMATIALRAARIAGQLISRALDRPDLTKIESKTPWHFVTNVSRQAEREVIYSLQQTYPDHGFITAESGMKYGDPANQDTVWIIDVLNGSANFIHGIPHFAISIACRIRGRIEHAVIVDPIRNEEFTASRGKGARLNDLRLRTQKKDSLTGTLIATGTAVKESDNRAFLDVQMSACAAGANMRQTGCPSLDLAYVAAGRFDGVFLNGLEQWELAAGCMLIQESGGLVSDFSGGQSFMESGDIAAGGAKVFKPLIQLIRKSLS